MHVSAANTIPTCMCNGVKSDTTRAVLVVEGLNYPRLLQDKEGFQIFEERDDQQGNIQARERQY